MSSANEPFPVPIGWTLPSEPAPSESWSGRSRGADVRAISVGGSYSDAEMALAMQLQEMEQMQAYQMSGQHNQVPDSVEESGGQDTVLRDPVWGEVHFVSGEPTLGQLLCFSCCPCWAVGCNGGTPPCLGSNQLPTSPEDSRRSCKRFWFSIAMLASMVQLFFLALSILLGGGFAPLDVNFTLGPKPSIFNVMGAKNAARLLSYGEWWRIFMPLALHGGIIHFAANLIVQLKLGVLLEVIWGPFLWSVIYFSTGIYSILASCVFLPDSMSVGSSGAVCGLIGADISFLLITWRQTLPRDIAERNVQLSSLLITVAFTLIMSALPLVDTAAHIGGFVGGFLLGAALFAERAQDRTPRFRRTVQVLGASLFFIICVATLVYLCVAVEPHPDLLEMCLPMNC